MYVQQANKHLRKFIHSVLPRRLPQESGATRSNARKSHRTILLCARLRAHIFVRMTNCGWIKKKKSTHPKTNITKGIKKNDAFITPHSFWKDTIWQGKCCGMKQKQAQNASECRFKAQVLYINDSHHCEVAHPSGPLFFFFFFTWLSTDQLWNIINIRTQETAINLVSKQISSAEKKIIPNTSSSITVEHRGQQCICTSKC